MGQITINNWTGGIANDDKVGVPNSYRFSRNLNIFRDANFVTLNPRTVKVSGSTVTDLVLWGIDGSPYNDNRYFYGEQGNIYRETSGGVWSNLRTVAGSNGQGLNVFANYLYYAGATTLGRYGLLSGTPTFVDNFLADGITNLDQSRDTSGNTYTVPTSITENATNRADFTPTRDPVQSIQVLIAAKGSGNWTLTLHDVLNNSLGAVTIANGSLVASGDQTFTITTLASVVIGNQYHFHLTSTVADGSVTTTTNADLNTIDYHEFFGILIDADFHPMELLLNGLVIGNNNYLAFWDNANYNPNQIELEDGYQVRALARLNEFVVAGAWRGESEDSAEDAKLYFWDGIEPTFNFSIPVAQGMPNALQSSKNRLIGNYGARGSLYVGTEPMQLLRELPRLMEGEIITIPPGAMTQYENRTEVGYTYFSDSVDIGAQKGVYEWGNRSDEFPEAFNFAYTFSNGLTSGPDLYAGMVKALGQDLYIGVQSDTSFWVDKVSQTNDPFTEGEFSSLIFDNGQPQKPKSAEMLVVEFEPLQSGETVTPKYAIDDDAYSYTFTTGQTVSTVGATKAVTPITRRFNDIAFGFNITSSTTYPKITSVYLLFSELNEERGW